MAEKKRLIGLLLEDIFTDFSKEIIQSVEKAIPYEKNIRLAVISGKYIDSSSSDINSGIYKSVYNSVYRLAVDGELEGVIVHLGSIDESRERMIKEGWFTRFDKIPKVLISSNLEGCVTVNYDNEPGIREALGYIINVNGITNLCMLGGRDDNFEARSRKRIFIECLKEHGIMFRPKMFEATDMSINTEEAAGRLLDRNPRVGAVFCVNDSSAVGLYKAMAKRGLVPGKDILVFGFDNTRMAGEMKPPLSSVGADNITLGQRAVEMLLGMINGEEVRSTYIPTRLYGRLSFPYESNSFNVQDLLRVDRSFIYRTFDDCFYRLKGEYTDRENVDLRRLFYEIISRMITAMNRRYVSMEEFGEIGRLIDIFFDKGAMEYTDPLRMLDTINRLQNNMVIMQKRFSLDANVFINRLFLRMKDRTVYALSDKNINDRKRVADDRERIRDFVVKATEPVGGSDHALKSVFGNFDMLGMRNTALFMYDEPVVYREDAEVHFPDHIKLCCAVKDGVLYQLPAERQDCTISRMLMREELSSRCRGFVILPVFFRHFIYGILICELTDDIYDRGEFIALMLGRTLFLDLSDDTRK
ncbi:MAG: substrate-binding domain-containing protein [Ruminiclostridium sp.]|nr:substrate-binding domain-containing protein [Ruminiclostridium sp.]